MADSQTPTAPEDEVSTERPQKRMSEGVGRMTEPSGEQKLDFNPDARSSSYVLRAGSALPEDRLAHIEKRVVLFRKGSELFAVDPDKLESTFGENAIAPQQSGTTLLPSDGFEIVFALTKGAPLEMERVIGTYNIVQYDGDFIGIPQSVGSIEWGKFDLAGHPDVIIRRTLHEVVDLVEQKLGIAPRVRRSAAAAGAAPEAAAPAKAPSSRVIPLTVAAPSAPKPPQLVGSVDAYNIVYYEGWFYGMPHALGPLDLQTTDVIEMPGVIRDVSRDVIEHEVKLLRDAPPAPAHAAAPSPAVAAAASPASSPSPPRLVGSIDGHNIVEYDGWFYGVPQSLGSMDLQTTNVAEMPGVVRDRLLTAVVDGIRGHTSGSAS